MERNTISSLSYVNQVVVSTFKPRPIPGKGLPHFSLLTKNQGLVCKKIGNNLYLEDNRRVKLLEEARATIHSFSLPFSSCREGLANWNDLPCDGSDLLEINR